MNFVEEKRRALLESLAGVEDDLLRRRAATDGWSVAEILDHLRMVEAGVARLITKRVAQAREAGLGDETSTSSVVAPFTKYSANLEDMVLKSPAGVQPRPDVDIAEAREGLKSSREALRAAVATADGLALGDIKHNHPLLGELDLYEWLVFLGEHEARHKKQIERTLQGSS